VRSSIPLLDVTTVPLAADRFGAQFFRAREREGVTT